jgi:hypothetical protein
MPPRVAILGAALFLARCVCVSVSVCGASAGADVEEPLDREALVALGGTEDAWQLPVLERAFDLRLARLGFFPAPLYPPDLEEELVAALESIARLDPSSASERARALLEIAAPDCDLSFVARGVLARNGDPDVYREALASFFDAQSKWSEVLAQADDPRLSDFRAGGASATATTRGTSASERLFLTGLERNLALAEGRDAIRALVEWAATAPDPSSPRRVLEALARPGVYEARIQAWLDRNARKVEPRRPSLYSLLEASAEPLAIQQLVLSLPVRERYRATRWLVERDHPALAGLPMSDEDVDRLYPYLVRSRERAIRERARRSRRARGRALASYLESPAPDDEEKRETLEKMGDARADALVASGAKLFETMETLLGEPKAESFLRQSRSDDTFLDALAVVPLAGAREKLEALASPAAIARLLRRPDRALSFPALDRMRRGKDPGTARAATLALVSLGAPGASTILRSELAASGASSNPGTDPDPRMVAAAATSPTDPGILQDLLLRAGSDDGASPTAFAALYRLQQRSPESFLALLSSGRRALDRRAYAVLSLSGNPRRLPLLVDVAVGAVEGLPEGSREAAFSALAESNPGELSTRLHRLAGDPDRSVRFRAAAALVPTVTTEAWALRLLMANLDSRSVAERRLARAAVSRLPRPVACALLHEIAVDGTAGSFGVLLFLDRSDPEGVRADGPLQKQLWAVLAQDATAGDRIALLAASRLSLGDAIAVVCRRLTAAGATAW